MNFLLIALLHSTASNLEYCLVIGANEMPLLRFSVTLLAVFAPKNERYYFFDPSNELSI